MQPVSTYGAILTQINTMNSSSQLVQKLSLELSSNNQGVNLADNSNRAQVIDLTSTKDQLNSYISSCTLGNVTTSLYTNSLTNILSIAKTALSAVQSLQGEYTGQASPVPASQTTQEQTDAYNAFQTLGQTINQSMTETTIGLNEQSPSGSYLYAGLRNPTNNPPKTAGGTPSYNLPPVVDLTKLPYFASTNGTLPGATAPSPANPTALASYVPAAGSLDQSYATTQAANPGLVDPPATSASGTLPVYDTDYNTGSPVGNYSTAAKLAWGNQNVTIDQNQTQTLNITSNNAAFQNLVNGLRAAKTACDQAGNYSTADRDSFMSQAYSSLSKAVSGIEGLQQTNGLSQLAFQSASQTHNSNLSLVTTQLDDDVAVNTTTVTAQLASVNSQLQSSYKVTSDLLSMSLINYLK
jgi:flagellin-like hook-associated protein FlgL